MMLGKRARHPMKRTTSMTEFSFEDLTIIPEHQQQQPSDQLPPIVDRDRSRDHRNQNNQNQNQNLSHQRMMAMISPRPIGRRNSADFALHTITDSSTFLNTCSLCNRRLAPGRDIYMYRGDSAFCSLECRHQQMAQDERREKEKNNKCSASASIKLAKESNPSSHSHSHSSPAGSHVSSANTETVAAL